MLHEAMVPPNIRFQNLMTMYHFHWRCEHYIPDSSQESEPKECIENANTRRQGRTSAAIRNLSPLSSSARHVDYFFANQQTLVPVSDSDSPGYLRMMREERKPPST